MDEQKIRHEAQVELLRSIGAARWPAPRALTGEAIAYASLSYALRGEDLALRNLFKWRIYDNKLGVYVDIGCGAPTQISNTCLFYSYGWRGLCIDANAGMAARWSAARPEDIFIAAAVGTVEGETTFYRHATNIGASRIGDQRPEGDFEAGVKVVRRRLDRLLRETIGERSIDFMSLDVEGVELDVLQSNDWARWRPKAILIECLDFNFNAPYAAPSVAFLNAQGYTLTEKIGENVLMVRPD